MDSKMTKEQEDGTMVIMLIVTGLIASMIGNINQCQIIFGAGFGIIFSGCYVGLYKWTF